MIKGYVAFILHAHLPYVRHPEHENFLEERWLFEAISESYIPLLAALESLITEGVDYKLTMSLSPTLLTMLDDSLLQERYMDYVENLIELSQREVNRTIDQPEFNRLALMYLKKYRNDLYSFKNRYNCNIIKAFKNLQDSGFLEIITCAATHGFLPLMKENPESIKSQIKIGVHTYEKYFGKSPSGIWLPECGYTPSIELLLKENGLKYFIMESHGILFADPRPVFGTYAPIVTPNGLVAFGRDVESSKQVWSSIDGYPGDYDYREFYRDIGYDLDYDYIKDYISPEGVRINTGIKYYRITGNTNSKQPYNPDWANNKTEIHASNFLFNREKQINYLYDNTGRPPIIVCPYDAELFGHWWYEGPKWIHALLKKAFYNHKTIKFATLSEYMVKNPIMQVSSPATSSWGHKGYNEIWLNSSNDWIYRHLHKAAERMVELARENRCASGLMKDALNQAARELLLAQSSDWAFIIRAGTTVKYAEKRIKNHIGRFNRLYHDIKENSVDESWLRDIEYKDKIFPDIDYSIYAG